MLPVGNCSYQIRLHGQLIAFEDSRCDAAKIVAARRSADGVSRHQVEAALDAEHRIYRLTLSYSSSLFTRKASYDVVQDDLRGRISGLAGPNEIVIKLGRFHEVDAGGFLIFRALIIDHVRWRGSAHWTGRVAVIDPNTLVAASVKQNCVWRDNSENSWTYEPRMGDREQIQLDSAGRILQRSDNRGVTAELMTTGTCC
jgi:hypothetical protein